MAKPKLHPAYVALKAVSDQLKWPVSHMTDLEYHDRGTIERTDGSPFGWVIGDRGTYIVWPGATLDVITSCGEAVAGLVAVPKWFMWDGKNLFPYRNAAELQAALLELPVVDLRKIERSVA